MCGGTGLLFPEIGRLSYTSTSLWPPAGLDDRQITHL